MRLFEEKPRSHTGHSRPTEPKAHYLDRTARPEFVKIREMLEDWFSRYPEGTDKKDLRKRFLSPIGAHHDAAFFELLLHETLLKLGCSLEIHPTLPGGSNKHTDFLVRSSKGDFYLEALMVTDESDMEAGARQRLEVVLETIDAISCKDFALDLSYEGSPATPPPIGKWKNEILGFLNKYDRLTVQAIEIDDRPTIEFTHEGLHLKFRLIPKNYPEKESPDEHLIWATLGPTEYIKTSESIRDKMNKKATKYGALDLPFVLAVNIKKGWFMSSQIMDALFGEEAMQYLRDRATGESLGSNMVRVGEGVWIKANNPNHLNVSAALFFENAAETNVQFVKATLYHNPWPEKPHDGILTTFPQMIPTPEGKYQVTPGQGMEELFGELVEPDQPIPLEFKLGDHLTKALKERS